MTHLFHSKIYLRALPMSFCLFLMTYALQASTLFAQRADTKPFLGSGTTKPKITIEQPNSGWTVDQMVEVSGTISDHSIDPIVVSVNGDRFFIRNYGGKFKRKFPIVPGKNSIVVQGSNKGGTVEIGKTVFAEIPQAPIVIILSSDTDGIYTDLHVYEPHPQSKDPFEEAKDKNHHIYWASTSSPSGGRFYLNSQGGSFDDPGYGPYLYTHRSPPKGIYRIDANYWPSGDKPHAVATLNITVFGGTRHEQKRVVKAPLIMPGETATLGYIRFDSQEDTQIFIPSIDPKPRENNLWPKWVIDAPIRVLGDKESI